MASNTSMLHVRLDDETKEKATAALNAMGLSMSEAVRLFLHRIATDQAFPFELRAPNPETRAAMIEADAIARSRRDRFATADALFDDLEKARRK